MKHRATLLMVGPAAIIVIVVGCAKRPNSDPSGEDSKVVEAKKTTLDNMRKIATAMVDFPGPNGVLRAGLYEPSGKQAGLSWRVAILPALNEETLYQEFKLQEPWDSEHNKKLFARMPAIYASPGKDAKDGHTYYRAFVGKDTVIPPPPPGTGGEIAPGVRWPFEITDGTSNTALFAEATEPVIWTKPDEIDIDLQKPFPKLGSVFPDGFYIAFADSSARFFKHGSLTDDILKAMVTPRGKEVFTLPDDDRFTSNPAATKR